MAGKAKAKVADGPEVPFPWSAITTFCRDCPFPMGGELDHDAAVAEWQKKAAAHISKSTKKHLVGQRLQVVQEGDAVPKGAGKAVTITVDGQKIIRRIAFS